MVETNDGFRIAEADLEIRGPGEFLGTRQAGVPDFRVANLLRDARMLDVARQMLSNLTARLAKTLTDGIGQFGGRLQLVGHGLLAIFSGLFSPFAMVLGMVIVVLDPVIQKLHELV